jgi:hypothetical protein
MRTSLGAGLATFVLMSATAGAFEPGTERVCVPSADGQRFECSEVSPTPPETIERPRQDAPASAAAPAPAPAGTPPTAATEARDLDHVPPDPPARPTSRLPPYLMQKPATSSSASAIPAPARDTSAREPVPAPTPQSKPAAPPAPAPAEAAPVQIPRAESVAAPPAPAPTQTRTEPANPATPAPVAAAPSPALDLLHDSRAFAALPAAHYTVVLASVRDSTQLDDLIATMQSVPGTLHLLRLDMPDGTWYSLCWSEFDTVEAARAARSRLPDHAAITSGWPRRIGLLQAEIAR